MADFYIVKQGDHLSSVAKEFGFSNYQTIWNDPANADLKKLRQNPNILFPGDSLFIPDHQQRSESCGTDQLHKFQAIRSKVKLRLVLEDLYEGPIANARCLLGIGDDFSNVTTDETGKIEQDIPPDARDVLLIVQDSETPFRNTKIPIRIGYMDPVEQLSGQKARLNNLGYFAGDPSALADEDFKSAVEEFQCENNLKVDGICGPQTQASLKNVHGC